MAGLAEIIGVQPRQLPVMSPLAAMGVKPTTLIVKQGKYYAVLPAEVDGQALDPQTAAALWKSGKIKELGLFDSAEKAQAFTRKPAMSMPRAGATVTPIEPEPYPWGDTFARLTKAPVAGLGKMGAALGESFADLIGAEALKQRFAAQQEAWEQWGGPVSNMTPWQRRATQAGQVAGMAAPGMLGYPIAGVPGVVAGVAPFFGLPYTEARQQGLNKPEALASALLQTGIEAAGGVPQAKAAFGAGQFLAGWLAKQLAVQPTVETGEQLLQEAVNPLVTGGRIPMPTLGQQAETAKETFLTSALAAPLMAAPGAVRPRETGPITEPVQPRLPVDMPLPETEVKYNPMLPKLADRVWEKTFSNGGATYSVFAGDRGGNKGYAVAAYPEREVIVPAEEFTPEVMQNYVAQNQDLLTKDPKANVGTWLNNESGMVHLDIVNVLPSLEKATEMGEKNNQLAIFDLKNFEEIWLKRLISPEADPTDLNNWVPITDETKTLDIFENPPDPKYMKVDLTVPEQFKPIMEKARQIVEAMEAQQAQHPVQQQAAPKWQPVVNFEKETISAPPANIVANTFEYVRDYLHGGPSEVYWAFSKLAKLARQLVSRQFNVYDTNALQQGINNTYEVVKGVYAPEYIASLINKYEPQNKDYYAGLLYNAAILDDKLTKVILRIMATGPKESIAARFAQYVLSHIEEGAHQLYKIFAEKFGENEPDKLFSSSQLPYAIGNEAYNNFFNRVITRPDDSLPPGQLAFDFNPITKESVKRELTRVPSEKEIKYYIDQVARRADSGPIQSRDAPAIARPTGAIYRLTGFADPIYTSGKKPKYAVVINLPQALMEDILEVGAPYTNYKKLRATLNEPALGFLLKEDFSGRLTVSAKDYTPVIFFNTRKEAIDFANKIEQPSYIKIKPGYAGIEVPIEIKPKGEQYTLFSDIIPQQRKNVTPTIGELIDERIITFHKELRKQKKEELQIIQNKIQNHTVNVRHVGQGLNAPTIYEFNDGTSVFVKEIQANIRTGFFSQLSARESGFTARAKNEAFVDDVRALLGFNRINTIRYGNTLYAEAVDLTTIDEIIDTWYKSEINLLLSDTNVIKSIAETFTLNIALKSQDMHGANIVQVNWEFITSIDNEFILDTPKSAYFHDFSNNALYKFLWDNDRDIVIDWTPLLRYRYYRTDILNMAIKARYNQRALATLITRGKILDSLIQDLDLKEGDTERPLREFVRVVRSYGL